MYIPKKKFNIVYNTVKIIVKVDEYIDKLYNLEYFSFIFENFNTIHPTNEVKKPIKIQNVNKSNIDSKKIIAPAINVTLVSLLFT